MYLVVSIRYIILRYFKVALFGKVDNASAFSKTVVIIGTVLKLTERDI